MRVVELNSSSAAAAAFLLRSTNSVALAAAAVAWASSSLEMFCVGLIDLFHVCVVYTIEIAAKVGSGGSGGKGGRTGSHCGVLVWWSETVSLTLYSALG
jgi:hypothetical protein